MRRGNEEEKTIRYYDGLLYDEELFLKWWKTLIPELQNDEVIIGILCARKKYYPELSRSQEILDKIIIKDKDRGYVKVRKFLRIRNGDYFDINGNTIPVKAMAFYIDLMPRSTLRAIGEFFKTVNQWQYDAILSPEFNLPLFRRLDTKLFSSIAKSPSRKPYIILDIDSQNPDDLHIAVKYFGNEYIKWITATRGGYHVIFDGSTKEARGNFYRKWMIPSVDKTYPWEVQSHQLQTVPCGTLQGGKPVIPLNSAKYLY